MKKAGNRQNLVIKPTPYNVYEKPVPFVRSIKS